jgi:hypothetical protein
MMIARKKAFPQVLEPACLPTHFTVAEARRAVREVMDEDRAAQRAAGGKRASRGSPSASECAA